MMAQAQLERQRRDQEASMAALQRSIEVFTPYLYTVRRICTESAQSAAGWPSGAASPSPALWFLQLMILRITLPASSEAR